jgi:hypothetical protein
MADAETVYVSNYQIKMGPGDVRLPGSLVPEFENWSYTVQRAHLERGRIMKMTRAQWEREWKANPNPVSVDTTVKKPDETPKKKRGRPKKVVTDDVELQRGSK